jgi:hypothetical protein
LSTQKEDVHVVVLYTLWAENTSWMSPARTLATLFAAMVRLRRYRRALIRSQPLQRRSPSPRE